MRNLIAKRPNLIHTGTGNSRTPIDLGVLQDATLDIAQDDQLASEVVDTSNTLCRTRDATSTEGDDYLSSRADGLSTPARSPSPTPPPRDSSSTGQARKRKSETTSEPEDVKPVILPSSHSAKSSKRPQKKSKLEELSGAMQTEEVTRQKEVELAKIKIESAAKVRLAAETTKVELKKREYDERSEKRKLKHEREMEKMRLKAQFRIEREKTKRGVASEFTKMPVHPTAATPTQGASSSNTTLRDSEVNNSTFGFNFENGVLFDQSAPDDHSNIYGSPALNANSLPDGPNPYLTLQNDHM